MPSHTRGGIVSLAGCLGKPLVLVRPPVFLRGRVLEYSVSCRVRGPFYCFWSLQTTACSLIVQSMADRQLCVVDNG